MSQGLVVALVSRVNVQIAAAEQCQMRAIANERALLGAGRRWNDLRQLRQVDRNRNRNRQCGERRLRNVQRVWRQGNFNVQGKGPSYVRIARSAMARDRIGKEVGDPVTA